MECDEVPLEYRFPPRTAVVCADGTDLHGCVGVVVVSLSFMYRYIVREPCSQFDSLPLTSLTISHHGRASHPTTTPRCACSCTCRRKSLRSG